MLKTKKECFIYNRLYLTIFLQLGLIHKEREELTVRFETYNEIWGYQKPSYSTPFYLYRRLLMIGLHFVYCINDKELQKITKLKW